MIPYVGLASRIGLIPTKQAKFNKAIELGSKEVVLWGNGEPLREFMHVKDLASAVFFAATKKIDKHLLNVGSGEEISIDRCSQGTLGNHECEMRQDGLRRL